MPASSLNVPDDVRQSLLEFVDQLVKLYGNELESVIAFGSAVRGGFSPHVSDVNLLVVYSDLNIADLDAVAKLAQQARRKHRVAPRFLSLRNLTNSARYFQIDFLEMAEAHAVLHGRDVLDGLEARPADLHWQIAHEVKRMRMRLKQQYWMNAGDAPMLREAVAQRFGSLVHLMRAYLRLVEGSAPLETGAILDRAAAVLGFDRAAAGHLLAARRGEIVLRDQELTEAFRQLMDLVRALDEHNDRAM